MSEWKGEWIPVSERLPELVEGMTTSEDVLTWDGRERHIGRIEEFTEIWWEQTDENTQKKREETSLDWTFDDSAWYDVTHWAELLPPPQGEER